MTTRTFQLELLPADGDTQVFKLREGGKPFAAGEVPAGTDHMRVQAAAQLMLRVFVGFDVGIHIDWAPSGPKRVTWSATWVREHQVRVVVTDSEAQEVVAGFEMLLDCTGAREDGIKRHELYDTLNETLTAFVEAVEGPLRKSGYEHNTASVVELLHRAITEPVLAHEFPDTNLQELN